MRNSNFETLRDADFIEETVLAVPSSPWWVNPESRIIFESEAVRDADSLWLTHCVREDVREGKCIFYFAIGSPHGEVVCDKILEQFKLLNLRAEISNFAVPDQQGQNVHPTLRQLKIEGSTIAIVGKPLVVGSVDDPNSKRQFQLEVTVNKLK